MPIRLERRLERELAPVRAAAARAAREARAAAARRADWRAGAALHAVLYRLLTPHADCPAIADTLRRGAAAVAALAAIPDTPRLRRADAALLPPDRRPDPRLALARRLPRLVDRYRGGARLGLYPDAAERLAFSIAWAEAADAGPGGDRPPAAAPAAAPPEAPAAAAAPPRRRPAPAAGGPLRRPDRSADRSGARPCEMPGAVRCGLFCRLRGAAPDCRLLRNRGLGDGGDPGSRSGDLPFRPAAIPDYA